MIKRIFVRFMRLCHSRWVKWAVFAILVVIITLIHFVMANNYKDSSSTPTWKFSTMLHSALLVVAVIIVVLYKKHIKRKLMEYGQKD